MFNACLTKYCTRCVDLDLSGDPYNSSEGCPIEEQLYEGMPLDRAEIGVVFYGDMRPGESTIEMIVDGVIRQMTLPEISVEPDAHQFLETLHFVRASTGGRYPLSVPEIGFSSADATRQAGWLWGYTDQVCFPEETCVDDEIPVRAIYLHTVNREAAEFSEGEWFFGAGNSESELTNWGEEAVPIGREFAY